jgi:hypothetical protein
VRTGWRFLVAAALIAGVSSSVVFASAAINTKITSGPAGSIASRSAAFKFKASVPRAVFRCKLDAHAWSSCRSPMKYRKLAQGHHTFQARARKGRAIDKTPARRSFTVDTVPPETTVLTGPSGSTTSRSPSFTFRSNEPGTFECRIISPSSSPPFAPCISPFSPASPLQVGAYTFEVRAVDAAGNAGSTPATRSFTVTAAEPTILPGPPTVFPVDTVTPDTFVYGPGDNQLSYVNGYTEDQTPSSTFESSEPASFECRITTAGSSPPFEPCDTPFTPASPLARDAFYTIEARAIDAAGNVDPTPGSWDFDVETPISEDQPTLDLAAATYFPDSGNRDVLAICAGSTPIDCPGGTALPPDNDQISTASSRSLVSVGGGTHRYDLTATHDSQTLNPVVLTLQGADCNLTWNSANGATPHWTITESLNFVTETQGHTVPGGKFISPSNISMTGVDSSDFAIGGSFTCTSGSSFYPSSALAAQYPSVVGADIPMCPALGPGYIAPCQPH